MTGLFRTDYVVGDRLECASIPFVVLYVVVNGSRTSLLDLELAAVARKHALDCGEIRPQLRSGPHSPDRRRWSWMVQHLSDDGEADSGFPCDLSAGSAFHQYTVSNSCPLGLVAIHVADPVVRRSAGAHRSAWWNASGTARRLPGAHHALFGRPVASQIQHRRPAQEPGWGGDSRVVAVSSIRRCSRAFPSRQAPDVECPFIYNDCAGGRMGRGRSTTAGRGPVAWPWIGALLRWRAPGEGRAPPRHPRQRPRAGRRNQPPHSRAASSSSHAPNAATRGRSTASSGQTNQ